ncbi:MAG: hypothetical protein IKY31_01300 [Bacteroidaceae bacterium]|nr:hypothetical protein [Bacteroidaceae bacterium]
MKKALLFLFVLLGAMGLRAQETTVVADTLKPNVVNELVVGKTYVLGAQSVQYQVSFTAPADGFLSITPSQALRSTGFYINGKSSTFTKVNGGFSEKGMAQGSVFTGKFYTTVAPTPENVYSFTVAFKEGVPYAPLQMTEVKPGDNSVWSGAEYYYLAYDSYKGQAYYNFSSAINVNDVVVSIVVGDKTYSPVKVTSAKNGVVLTGMPDTMSAAISAGLIKAGETFEVKLSNIKDVEFSANTIADQTFTYTLASTACTGVNPAAGSRSELPESVVFSFDGNVSIDNAKFYFVNANTGVETELSGATVEGTSIKIPVPAIQGMLPKAYNIVARGVTDADGNVIKYGETNGQLTVSYTTSNGIFNNSVIVSPAHGAEVSSLKTFTFTFAGDVVYDASQASSTKIKLTNINEDVIDGDVTYAIDANVVTFTLSKEVFTPGTYYLEVPSKLFWAKESYDKDNLSTASCYYMASKTIGCTVKAYQPTTVTPANGETLEKLETITLSFSDEVACDEEAKVAVLMQKQEGDDDEFGMPTVGGNDTVAVGKLLSDNANPNNVVVDLGCIKSLGVFSVVVPEGAIWAVNDETKKTGQLTYQYNVEPVEEELPDTLVSSQDQKSTICAGKTYIIKAGQGNYNVEFTAEADGFLTIELSSKISVTGLKINGASSTFTKDSNNGITKKGIAKGSVFSAQYYTNANVTEDVTMKVIFEEGVPYEPLTMTLANPVDGGEWSGAVEYKSYGTKGAPHYEFSSKISKDVTVTVKIGDKVYEKVACTVDTYNPKLDINGLPAIMTEAIAEGLIKAGETFTLTLSNLVDNEFPSNKLDDVTFTYTVASTSCTGVTPAANTGRTVLPDNVVFSFDGTVLIDNAKFYFVNKDSGEKTELEGVVDGTSVKITVPALEGLLPKAYDIVAEGVTDANGKVITYGETVGQLAVSYGTGNGYFKAVAEPAHRSEVSSLKTYTFTLPGDVVYDASLASSSEITISKMNESNYSWETLEGVTASYEINENVVSVVLSEEIATPGDYMLEVPAKLFWSKDLYDEDNLSTNTCYYMSSQNITCTIPPYGPTAVTPEVGATLNKLEKLTLTFDERIEIDDTAKVVVMMYQEYIDQWGHPDMKEIKVGEYTIGYDYVNDCNAIIDFGSLDSAGIYNITIPEGCIWAEANESKVIGRFNYQFYVDPEYWDPSWIVEVGKNCTQEAPYQLVAGRKYEVSEMYSYLQFTAEEDGRVYITPLTDGYNEWSQHDSDWMYSNDLKKTEDGDYWFGVAEGETYNIRRYGFGTCQFQLTFEAGTPYETLTYIASSPVDGGIYSKSVSAEYSDNKGSVDFKFSCSVDVEALQILVVLPAQDNKQVDITEDVYIESSTIYSGGAYLSLDMRDVVEELGLKHGDKFQVVLKNVQDAAYADNKLAEEVKIELTYAAIICTSVSPGNDWDVDAIPTEISLQFDGEVSCTEGKGYIIDLANTENKQEFEIKNLTTTGVENYDGSIIYKATVTLPEATITLSSRKFAIELQGLVSTEGHTVSYGSEFGKFVIEYALSAETLVPVTPSEDDEIEVESIKTTTLTFAEDVVVSPEAEAYFYCDGEEIVGELVVDANDSKSVIITWSQEVTKAGSYNITIEGGSIYNSKFDADADDYGVENGATYNPYLSYYFVIPANNSATTVASITPAAYEGRMWGTPISKLPTQVVIEFDGVVKEVISAYGQSQGLGGGWSLDEDDDMEVPAANALKTEIVENVLYVTIPEEDIETLTFGYYNITINAIGEDDKPIGFAMDDWGDIDMFAEQISFNYYVEKMLDIEEMIPADGSIVKQLDKVTITFSDEIFEVTEDANIALFDENYDDAAEVSVTFEGNVATLTFDAPVTAAGTYTLLIGESSFATEDYLLNGEMYFEFTVDPTYVEALAIVSATPEDGATVEGLTTVEVKLNKEVGYLYKGMLMPADGGDDAHYASLTQSETDPTVYTLDFTLLYEDGVKLRKDVTYTMTLEAYASEEAWNQNGACETVELTYVGAYEGFKYSDVTFEGITPNEETVITDKSQNKFVVKFSGAVNMVEELTYINMGQGNTQTFESIVANDDKTEYTLTIAESVMDQLTVSINIIFAAEDLNGNRVQGTSGEGEYSVFAVEFKSEIIPAGIDAITVDSDVVVYNVAGVVVAQGKASEVLSNLNKGIYIVNGKKYVVK